MHLNLLKVLSVTTQYCIWYGNNKCRILDRLQTHIRQQYLAFMGNQQCLCWNYISNYCAMKIWGLTALLLIQSELGKKIPHRIPSLNTYGYCPMLLETVLDSFTVCLHSPNGRHLPAIRAVQGDCQCPPKNEIPVIMCIHNPLLLTHNSVHWGFLQYLFWSCSLEHQPIGYHISYPTNGSLASRFGLWSSLHLSGQVSPRTQYNILPDYDYGSKITK